MSEKNKAAVALGKQRWVGVSAADRTKAAKKAAKARAAKLSPARRKSIARKASKAAAIARTKKAELQRSAK